MTKRYLLIAMSILVGASSSEVLATEVSGESPAVMVFPGKQWTRSTPEAQGMDPAPLQQIDVLMKKAKANGVLIRNGYLVGQWNCAGAADEKLDIQSCGKSITSLMLGVAIDDGVVPSLDTKVKQVYPEFSVGEYTQQITFRHLITMTAGIANEIYAGNFPDYGINKPGEKSRYQNSQPHEVAKALTYLYGRHLQDVFNERVLGTIGGEMLWPTYRGERIRAKNGQMVPSAGGYGCSRWTARDLARVGHLYLNRGLWDGKRVVSELHVKQVFTDIPQPICEYRSKARWHGQTAAQRAADVATLRYSLAWWSRSFYEKDEWYMSGNGSQFCFVFPKEKIVMTKINDWRNPVQVNHQEFYPLIKQSVELGRRKQAAGSP